MKAQHALAAVLRFAHDGEDPRIEVEYPLGRTRMKGGLSTTDAE